MGTFEDTSIRFDGIHRQKYIGLGRNSKAKTFGSRLIASIYKVWRYDTNATAYVLINGGRTYKKNDIKQNGNWRFVASDIWDNPNLTPEQNESQIGGLPIVDDNPQQ
jgi:hypothetical protein